MRRWQRLVAISGVTVGTLLVGAGAAYAYFTYTDGSNAHAAEAVGAVLYAPTAPTATVHGGGSITIGWTAPATQVSGAQYQVTQTSPAPARTICTVVAATSCTATGLTPATAYTFTVAAVLDAWQSPAITTTATTSATTLSIALSSGPYTAGAAASVRTVTAMLGASVDTTVTGPMTLSWSGLATSPNGTAPAYPTTSVTFANGVAILNSPFIPTRSGSATLVASDSAAASVTGSVTFTVSPGPAAALSVATSPGGASGGVAFTTQPVVDVVDPEGNAVPSDHSTVTLAITPGTPATGGPGTLSGCTQSETAGVVTFSGCAINTVGTGYKLTATDASLTSATTAAFNVIAGPAVSLSFTTSPGASTSTVPFTTQPVVTLYDAGGNVATGSTSPVTLSVQSGTGTLACTTNPLVPSAGVAAFAGCAITLGTDGSFTLSASAAGLPSATSASFTVYGGAAKLVFATEPTDSTGGAALTTQPVIDVVDAQGNTVPTATNAITLSIQRGKGTLACTTNPLDASAGIAAFKGCVISLGTEGTFRLRATATGLPNVMSATFSVAGPATTLVFTTQPSNSTDGTVLPTQPAVTVEDSSGDVVTAAATPITLAIQTGTGTLACTTNPLTPSVGVAAFTGCAITLGTPGSFTLSATEGGLSQSSAPFTVASTATKVVITTQPSNATNGVPFATQPVVEVEDAAGDVVTKSAAAVTLAINTGAGTLACTTDPLAATAGVATFAGCKVTLGTQGSFTLVATSPGLTSAASATFTVAGSASQLVFATSPGASTGGTAFGTQPVVEVEDSSGDLVTASTASVALAVGAGTGTLGGCGANPVAAVSGVATFTGCSISLGTEGSFKLVATSSGLASAASATFTVAGAATKLAFTTSPGASTGGTAFGTQPVVAVEDAAGDVVTTSTALVTLAVGTGTGTLGGCTANPIAATSGVATFASCAITLGTQGAFTLTATSPGLSTGSSGGFTVAGAASQLVFAVQPVGAGHGAPFATQPVVYVEDSSGDRVTTSVISITLAITPGTGTKNAVLTCTADPLPATGGIASFSGCTISHPGTGYTLTATGPGVTATVSATFRIT